MGYFQNKNPDLGKFFRVFQWKMLVYYSIWPFCLFCGSLVCFWAIEYILWLFCIFFRFKVFCTKKNLATLAATLPQLKPFSESIRDLVLMGPFLKKPETIKSNFRLGATLFYFVRGSR
jgi:hypothetical protein